MNEKKLKPVVFIKGRYNYHGNNELQQNILLKALQITTNPMELKKIIGVSTVAQVYRTLDKLSIRKDYHAALEKAGIGLETIIEGIKREGYESENSGVRLKAWTTLLKSVGLDEYKEKDAESSKTWEDTLREVITKEKVGQLEAPKIGEYEVALPAMPADVKAREDEDERSGQELYGKY